MKTKEKMKKINIALIGCGSFARGVHLPNLRAEGRFCIRAVVDPDFEAARSVAEAEGAEYWSEGAERALSDPGVEAVFIVTPHHLHAKFAIQAAHAGKHIFCEKPMGMDEAECLAVEAAVRAAGVKYTVGYNRSLAPFTLQARCLLAGLQAPIMVFHRIADWFPYSRGWLLDASLSGGRLIGEAGHALDMICQLVGQDPVRVYAEGGNLVGIPPGETPDSAIITLGFPNGSAGVLFLSSIANNGFPKEEIQITCANHTLVINNFESMHIYSPEGNQAFTLPAMDKGQPALVSAFAQAVIEDTPAPSSLDAALRTSRCTFAALESIRTRQTQRLS